LREVWNVIDIYEQDLARLSPGKAVQVRVHSYPDRVFRGTVDNIGATVERTTRTVKVRVLLPNPGQLLKPGMFANVSLTGASAGSERALMVPAAAVQRDAATSIVFVALGNGRFQARTIVVGRTNSSWIEVTSGISVGDSVVTTGAFLLKSQLRKSQLGESHPH
jgi:RND family efflux transporter MFP subunit